jgi:hypothetical protein
MPDERLGAAGTFRKMEPDDWGPQPSFQSLSYFRDERSLKTECRGEHAAVFHEIPTGYSSFK